MWLGTIHDEIDNAAFIAIAAKRSHQLGAAIGTDPAPIGSVFATLTVAAGAVDAAFGDRP